VGRKREVRLKAEYASWYPGLTVAGWTPASTAARIVLRQLTGTTDPSRVVGPRWEIGPRLLDPGHFHFRGGPPAHNRGDARTRREDHAVTQPTYPRGTHAMNGAQGWSLSDVEIHLLQRCADGHTHRPSDRPGADFAITVNHLLRLRDLGLIRLDDGRIMQSQSGRYLLAGPCDVTDAGRRALEQDRGLGPRA
jgi:hypothetical protein